MSSSDSGDLSSDGSRESFATREGALSGDKTFVNAQLGAHLRVLCVEGRRVPAADLRCLFLESPELNTAGMLAGLGALPRNFSIPNDCPVLDEDGDTVCEVLQGLLPSSRCYPGSLHALLRVTRHRYHFIFADYCGTVEGTREGFAPVEDARLLYERRLLEDGSLVAYTFCRRGSSPDALPRFELAQSRAALAAGYTCTCVDRLHYRNMVCAVFFVTIDRAPAPSRVLETAPRAPAVPRTPRRRRDARADSHEYVPSPPRRRSGARSDGGDIVRAPRLDFSPFRLPREHVIAPAPPLTLASVVGGTLVHAARDTGSPRHFWAVATVERVSGANWVHLRAGDERWRIFVKRAEYTPDPSTDPSPRSWFLLKRVP